MPAVREPGLRPFNESGYEILDEDLMTKGELVICAQVVYIVLHKFQTSVFIPHCAL